MSDDTDPDRDAVPEVHRPIGRPAAIRSLPGPSPSHSLPVLAPPSPTIDEESEARRPATDIVRTPTHLYVTLEIPGVTRESIDVTATLTRLTVHAIRSNGPAFHLDLELPERIEPLSTKATCRNGVLDITLKRAGVLESAGGEPNAR